MFVLRTIVMVGMILSVNCECSNRWWTQVQPNETTCGRGNFYIRELFFLSRAEKFVDYFRGAECCGPPPAWNYTGTLVKYVDWFRDVSDERLYVCPSGFFLNGFYKKNDSEVPIRSLSLANEILARVRCGKPAAYPVYYQDCLEHKISTYSASCRDGYYVTGLKQKASGGSSIHDFEALICCSMAQKPYEVQNFEEVKRRVMDVTLMRIAELADALGFKHCKGADGMYCGEDINYNASYNRWETNNVAFDANGNSQKRKTSILAIPTVCDDEQLKIIYDNWDLAVSNITYDEIVNDILEPETMDSGVIYNRVNATVKEIFEISQLLQEVITHSVQKTISTGTHKSISLNFKYKTFDGKKTFYSAVVDLSNTTRKTVETLDEKTYRRRHQITLQPYTAARYNVTVSKSKQTIRYTAFVTATFSVHLQSFLKSPAGFSGTSINYHSRFQDEEGFPCFNYRFGDENIPFYKALKKQRGSNSGPWLWNEMEDSMPGVREVIDRLTDERLYEFKLQGTLEKVSGTKIDVVWDTVKLPQKTQFHCP